MGKYISNNHANDFVVGKTNLNLNMFKL